MSEEDKQKKKDDMKEYKKLFQKCTEKNNRKQ